MKRSRLLRVLFCFVLTSLIAPAFLASQETFPEGTAQATTTMNPDRDAARIPFIDLQIRDPESSNEVAFSVQLMLLLTFLSLAPSILILTTSFLRISIVLDFVKRALSLQQVPPTQVLNGIALFLTLFIMWPTFTLVYDNAYRPLADGELSVSQAYTEAEGPIRMFMYRQMSHDTSSIATFMTIAKLDKPRTLADVPTRVLVPAYILHELTIAFKIGILLYLPFIVIDMVVASILMSMGMIMLPPVQISMPFKLILFVLVDGWGLLTQQLFNSFL